MRNIKKHIVTCDTMNIHMQRQTTGMPYLLKDKQCIQQIARPRMGKKNASGRAIPNAYLDSQTYNNVEMTLVQLNYSFYLLLDVTKRIKKRYGLIIQKILPFP